MSEHTPKKQAQQLLTAHAVNMALNAVLDDAVNDHATAVRGGNFETFAAECLLCKELTRCRKEGLLA